ncbi:aminotransferase class V-fold PLP-dependent enzyme [Pacificibacter marinus]|uniref:aminotransferase class V-fold PLP-dependent enzyme n=1 Tax=Pacificibacter marinus TaxID=658057 RepID=UPI001C075D83|nr:aminotransferase class V-fold PLP-dependent enzyme [Pacificibacter marinus]MBU2867547.1 aminotransferase class V-fold PLP-dependent enzyme [Pacificibacter marinus]
MASTETASPHSSTKALIAQIRAGVIGEGRIIPGPYGPRPLIYADFIASGRSLDLIETSIRDNVLPTYGNTHTETSYTGRRTTTLREEARQIIADAVGATKAHAVVFTGNGATAAFDRLVRGMEIEQKVRAGDPPVVFLGPYEHHSNDLPWRDSGAIVERISLNAAGHIDLDHLADRLNAHQLATFKIGAFSAASNVTGVRTDLKAISKLLHQNNAVFICDFAAAAPYVDMQLSLDPLDPLARIDAIVYSSHKFIGGPGASGVLIADKRLFTSDRPSVTGGGTVSYVTADHHTYVRDIERREEAGTPGIVGDIRAGAVMALKETVGSATIEAHENAIIMTALNRLSDVDGIDILGPKDADRIGVMSFNISCEGQQLHYGFVVALLNDLFGIQARGGCSCAGPYAHELLHISNTSAASFENIVSHGQSIMRPGWVRLGFNYFFDDETVDYIISAILFISENGLRFLSDYTVDVSQGVWRHKHAVLDMPPSIKDFWTHKIEAQTLEFQRLSTFLTVAAELAATRDVPIMKQNAIFDLECEALRDFWMPHDVMQPPKINPDTSLKHVDPSPNERV